MATSDMGLRLDSKLSVCFSYPYRVYVFQFFLYTQLLQERKRVHANLNCQLCLSFILFYFLPLVLSTYTIKYEYFVVVFLLMFSFCFADTLNIKQVLHCLMS